MVPVNVRVPLPLCRSKPAPETPPAKVIASPRLNASVLVLALRATSPTIEPVVPPVPICSVPVEIVVPPV
ncbi:hypothetical protein AFCDBAGC_1271 [Methylobacterium cerastii]|uniref:Uncharacterized protein n=1 Tax=Methylobacterium cerastii TaxID=932741 RepID=A0ABQ4QEC8_9HYPH|nr:hypothetical protein AFCDBAGC_1271 [Methylobacterium cerastii]